MERVKLRHREAEELIVKAKEQAKERERQRELLRAKGRSIPPDAGLLGCWQLIELTVVSNEASGRLLSPSFGTRQLFFTALMPDRRVIGTEVKTGESLYRPAVDETYYWKSARTADIDGRIVGEGLVNYSLTPTNLHRVYTSYGVIRRLVETCEARWQGWEMEGETSEGSMGAVMRCGFKAVRVDDPMLQAVSYALGS
jgi:hypothetical protein